tara:strand:- start:70 stop:267 length:198 start_codon:yes stop_codon:yes gene_type:complete
MPIPFEKYPELFQRHSHGITLKDAIQMYEWLLTKNKIRENGSGHQRLKQLKLIRSSGIKNFPRRK